MLDSVFAYNQPAGLVVHFLHDADVSVGELERLQSWVESCGAGWLAHSISPQERDRCPRNRRFGQVAWYRVFLPELLPEVDRVLYLDCDTIIRRNLSELWMTDLRGMPLGAVVNPLYPFMDCRFLDELGVRAESYFNSGVLLFDLQKWRASELTEHLLVRAREQGRQEWPDQNALNVVLRDFWLPLPPAWNAQNTLFDLPMYMLAYDEAAIVEARANPAIIHFIGPYKPWHFRCKHKFRHLYWEHLANTPWRDSAMLGKTILNRILWLLPEQWGWQVDVLLKKLRR